MRTIFLGDTRKSLLESDTGWPPYSEVADASAGNISRSFEWKLTRAKRKALIEHMRNRGALSHPLKMAAARYVDGFLKRPV